MQYIRYLHEPELRNPVVVAALGGWNDAADSATTAIKFLIDRWKPTKFADIDIEDFFVFTETRPTIKLVDGIQRTLIWPNCQFLSHQTSELSHDIILFLGSEPQLKWKTFSKCFLDVCKKFHASEVVLLGALLADVPHSISVPITGTASNADLKERLKEMDIHSSRYEGPTGMIGVLQDGFRRAAIPAASIWAAAPHYLAATPNIKVTSALLTYLNTYMSFGLDLSDIQTDAIRFEEQISTLVARDPEASAYVRKLEEQVTGSANADEDDEEDESFFKPNPDRTVGTGPLPSAESLIRGVEELLRKQRENGEQKPIDDDDSE
ncbi:MAG TPA: PAC2 family protein [Ktedonobacteraceae bacterium]|nr:PAC2 family protein [Ktedonobacteraceae bacterium]